MHKKMVENAKFQCEYTNKKGLITGYNKDIRKAKTIMMVKEESYEEKKIFGIIACFGNDNFIGSMWYRSGWKKFINTGFL